MGSLIEEAKERGVKNVVEIALEEVNSDIEYVSEALRSQFDQAGVNYSYSEVRGTSIFKFNEENLDGLEIYSSGEIEATLHAMGKRATIYAGSGDTAVEKIADEVFEIWEGLSVSGGEHSPSNKSYVKWEESF